MPVSIQGNQTLVIKLFCGLLYSVDKINISISSQEFWNRVSLIYNKHVIFIFCISVEMYNLHCWKAINYLS
jgi:hypothetical protein